MAVDAWGVPEAAAAVAGACAAAADAEDPELGCDGTEERVPG
jgi:hypothetical protein